MVKSNRDFDLCQEDHSARPQINKCLDSDHDMLYFVNNKIFSSF